MSNSEIIWYSIIVLTSILLVWGIITILKDISKLTQKHKEHLCEEMNSEKTSISSNKNVAVH